MKKMFIIIGFVLLIAVIAFIGYNSYSNSKLVNNVDLKKLSPQDLATYNSLLTESDKQDFLKLLNSNSPAVNTVKPVVKVADNSTTANVVNGTSNTVPVDQVKATENKVVDWFKNLFTKKPVPPYVQILPIDENGYDANGKDAIGIGSMDF